MSYLRKEGSNYAGKVYNFYRDACTPRGAIRDLFKPSELHVCLVLYVASAEACTYLERAGSELFGNISFSVQAVHSLPRSLKTNQERDGKFVDVLRKYYDPSIETRHYLRGKHEKPYLGFNECGLPLVLSHNTPNNSVSLLWFEEHRRFRGLFPRTSRHR